MIYTAQQPQLFPPVYMLNRWAQVEQSVQLAEAQFQRHGGHHRTRINTPNGPTYLTVSAQSRNRRPLDQIAVVDPEWFLNYLDQTLPLAYGRCAGFRALRPELARLWTQIRWRVGADGTLTLAALNTATTLWVFEVLGWAQPQVTWARAHCEQRPANPSAWIAQCAGGADQYLAGRRAMDAYLDPEPFRQRGIGLWAHAYTMPAYTRVDGQTETDAYVSILDPLLTHGVDFTNDLVAGDAREPW